MQGIVMQSRFLSRITEDSNQNRRRCQILSARGREACVYVCVCMCVCVCVCRRTRGRRAGDGGIKANPWTSTYLTQWRTPKPRLMLWCQCESFNTFDCKLQLWTWSPHGMTGRVTAPSGSRANGTCYETRLRMAARRVCVCVCACVYRWKVWR